jgi:hypothetical protein
VHTALQKWRLWSARLGRARTGLRCLSGTTTTAKGRIVGGRGGVLGGGWTAVWVVLVGMVRGCEKGRVGWTEGAGSRVGRRRRGTCSIGIDAWVVVVVAVVVEL